MRKLKARIKTELWHGDNFLVSVDVEFEPEKDDFVRGNILKPECIKEVVMDRYDICRSDISWVNIDCSKIEFYRDNSNDAYRIKVLSKKVW